MPSCLHRTSVGQEQTDQSIRPNPKTLKPNLEHHPHALAQEPTLSQDRLCTAHARVAAASAQAMARSPLDPPAIPSALEAGHSVTGTVCGALVQCAGQYAMQA